MLDTFFRGIFDSDLTQVIAISDFLLCMGTALLLGVAMAGVYMLRSRYTKSFVVTLILLPAVVCVVIMMVNGNIGAGVAVAGAFSLVRFRSVPGTAKEICMLFLAMGAGLIAGMGYLGFAAVFTLVMCGAYLLCNLLDLGARQSSCYKTLQITIPEDLNDSGVFDEILQEYTRSYELVRVKTTNMGSMFRLTYSIVLKQTGKEKEMIDQLRCRNGNLEITLSQQEAAPAEL